MTITTRRPMPIAARLRVLRLLDAGPLDAVGIVVYRVRRDVLAALVDAGLVRFRPYGKPPSWTLTRDGAALVDTCSTKRD